jgi:hypothetical protein
MKRKKCDGYWRCAVKMRAKQLRSQAKYEKGLRGRLTRKKYDIRKRLKELTT